MQPVTPNHQSADSEEDSLLLGPSRQHRHMNQTTPLSLASWAGWKPHPYWLIPVVLLMSMSRGITMAPRIQVYKAIACRSLTEEWPGLALDQLLLTPPCGEKAVQARAAKIQASVVTTMSVLSAFTTGFWSRRGDKHGRKFIFAAFFIGALLMESVFMLVMRPNSIFSRYGEKWILAGPIIEGFVGGLSVFNGVVHAYVSDCTRHGSRSTIFSTVQGMVFVGLATGPWFSGFVLPKTGYSSSFFFCSIGLIVFNLLYVVFVCPESLDRPQQPAPTENRLATEIPPDFKAPLLPTIRNQLHIFISALLLPLFTFTPRRLPGQRKKSYIMIFVGLSLLFYLISTGVYSAKYLYAQHVYSWTTAELGYYMSILWIARAFNLLIFLPIILSYLKPKSTTAPGLPPNAHDIAAELTFDRRLAQISVGVDGLADALVATTGSRSQPLFVSLSCLSSFTSGGNPALHSLGAVCLHACGYSAEVGSMFGAMAVLSAVAHIISPYIYAGTYSRTVATFPEAIFVLAACLLFSAVLMLSRVKPDKEDIALVHSRQNSTGAVRQSYDYEAVPSLGVDDEDSDEVGQLIHQRERTISSAQQHH